MSDIYRVPTKKNLDELGKKNPGDLAFCQDTGDHFVWKNNKWKPTEVKSPNGFSVSVYDINKAAYKQMPAINIDDYEKELNRFGKRKEYYLLYGKEIGYFTLFKRSAFTEEAFFHALKECLNYIAEEIKALEKTEDGNYEIWIVPKQGYEITVLYLFDYENGVIVYDG